MSRLYDLFHKEVVDISTGMINVSEHIKTALKSNAAVDLFLLFPGGTDLDKELISLCDMAITGGKALLSVADNAGLEGRMQRLSSDLTALQHGNKHDFGYYVKCVETVFRDLIGKGDN